MNKEVIVDNTSGTKKDIARKYPSGISAFVLSLFLIFLEVLIRYLLDKVGSKDRANYIAWDAFQTEVETILSLTLIAAVIKGWAYFILVFILINLKFLKPKPDERAFRFVMSVLAFLPLIAFDVIYRGFVRYSISDGVIVYMIAGVAFYFSHRYMYRRVL